MPAPPAMLCTRNSVWGEIWTGSPDANTAAAALTTSAATDRMIFRMRMWSFLSALREAFERAAEVFENDGDLVAHVVRQPVAVGRQLHVDGADLSVASTSLHQAFHVVEEVLSAFVGASRISEPKPDASDALEDVLDPGGDDDRGAFLVFVKTRRARRLWLIRHPISLG